jgi:hypothetical protein
VRARAPSSRPGEGQQLLHYLLLLHYARRRLTSVEATTIDAGQSGTSSPLPPPYGPARFLWVPFYGKRFDGSIGLAALPDATLWNGIP